MVTVKRGALLFGCAVALSAAPLAFASPAAAKECPWGTKLTHWNTCVSGVGTASAPVVNVPPSSGGGPNIVNNPNGFDSVNGIPCTPENYGTCYALSQQGG